MSGADGEEAAEEDPARAEAVDDGAYEGSGQAAQHSADAHGARKRRPAPPEVIRKGFDEYAEGGVDLNGGPQGNHGHDADDDPAIVEPGPLGVAVVESGRLRRRLLGGAQLNASGGLAAGQHTPPASTLQQPQALEDWLNLTLPRAKGSTSKTAAPTWFECSASYDSPSVFYGY